jgi:hypothetical protein
MTEQSSLLDLAAGGGMELRTVEVEKQKS